MEYELTIFDEYDIEYASDRSLVYFLGWGHYIVYDDDEGQTIVCEDDPKYVKIGYTTDLAGRLAAIRQGVPDKTLRLLFAFQPEADAKQLERDLHTLFKAYRHHGEWFGFGGLEEALAEVDLVKCLHERDYARRTNRDKTGDEWPKPYYYLSDGRLSYYANGGYSVTDLSYGVDILERRLSHDQTTS